MFEISGYRKAYRVDNIFMKNFLIILVVALFTISCQKQTTLQPEFQANETIKINVNENLELVAYDVLTNNSQIIRRIDFYDSKTKLILQSYTLQLTSTEGSILEKVKSKKFTGSFIIYSNGYSVMSTSAVRGVFKDFYRTDTKKNLLIKTDVAEGGGDAPCSLTSVHDCVSFKIDDMNFTEYVLCLASAPACYAGVWAICAEDVCIHGKTYVNPY